MYFAFHIRGWSFIIEPIPFWVRPHILKGEAPSEWHLFIGKQSFYAGHDMRTRSYYRQLAAKADQG